jgi:uncharacterized membrane protein YagU involved in acid resistance
MRGAAAGFAATVPMTIAMEGLRAWLPREQVRRMPPREIVDRTVAQTGQSHYLDEADRILITTAAHFGFGAAAGAAYGAIFDSSQSRGMSTLTGIGYGLAVWALAYGVGLPSLGLHPAATNDTEDRNEVLIASHVVWGAALGILASRDEGRGKRELGIRD